MATQAAKPVSKRTMKTDLGQPSRKEELESEVSMLHKMLDHEEKVNKILENTISRPDGSAIHIPSFLPPKVKELLAELSMVEDEITRLERQIGHLQKNHSQEQKLSKESNIMKWQHGSLSHSPNPFPLQSNPRPSFSRVNDGAPLETKALYFISKAIKGDYSMNPLTYMKNERNADSGGTAQPIRENYISGNTVSTRGEKQNPTSPKLPPRNSTTKRTEPEAEFSFDVPQKTVSNLELQEEKSNKLQANKLSESIMKCLIFIFVRLLRTSRAIEIEKSGTVSRSTHTSISSRSFRVDTGVNLNSSIQKESKQQDPYGIFDTEDSVPRDIGPYKNLVRFTSVSLDSKTISKSSSSALLLKLRVLMNNLQSVDLRFLSQNQKLAFWINMHNACIMHGFLQYGVPSNQDSLLSLMNKATLNIGGNKINVTEIENFILRQRANPNVGNVYMKGDEHTKESVLRSLYGLDSPEPNIIFALCCGTRSSPAVRIYSANGIEAELEKSKLDYLQAAMVVTQTKKVLIPELLLQNTLDFARDVNSLLEWICNQLPTSWTLRKSMVEYFRGHNSRNLSDIVEKIPYDFEFQYLLSI